MPAGLHFGSRPPIFPQPVGMAERIPLKIRGFHPIKRRIAALPCRLHRAPRQRLQEGYRPRDTLNDRLSRPIRRKRIPPTRFMDTLKIVMELPRKVGLAYPKLECPHGRIIRVWDRRGAKRCSVSAPSLPSFRIEACRRQCFGRRIHHMAGIRSGSGHRQLLSPIPISGLTLYRPVPWRRSRERSHFAPVPDSTKVPLFNCQRAGKTRGPRSDRRRSLHGRCGEVSAISSARPAVLHSRCGEGLPSRVGRTPRWTRGVGVGWCVFRDPGNIDSRKNHLKLFCNRCLLRAYQPNRWIGTRHAG